ncbi:MAG TPA: ATP-binding protein, partial [Planctomycetota bacterium]|nr:ATP-binding protein [Planctomycetota bacterium]
SEQIYNISGFPAEVFLKGGKPYLDLIVPEDVPLIEASVQRALAEHRPYEIDYRIRHKNGELRWVSDRGVATLDAQRRPLHYDGVVIDITDRKNAEEDLRQRTEELKAANTELDSFAYTVSHDLRAPLRTMHRFSDLLLQEYEDKPLDAEAASYLKRIAEGSKQMDLLIQALLSYSRLSREEIVLEPVSLERAAREALEALAGDLDLLKARVDVESPLPQVMGEQTLIGQVFSNLLSNAIRFMPEGVTPRVRIRAERLGRQVRVWIEDNGVGIEPEHHERIFKIFERLDPRRNSGTGIGLAIVRKAMEQMRGAVGLESAPGKGSRFWVQFRAVDVGR